MRPLLFATTNTEKFDMAHNLCTKAGITLEQVVIDIDEIQGEDPEMIVRDKAQKAFKATGKAVVVSDDSWNFLGLNGFPGAYMKSMNHWLSPQHFIDLMQHVDDRSVLLHQFLAYQDAFETVIFRKDISGKVLKKPRGDYGVSLLKVVALDSDDGSSIYEIYENGMAHTPERLKSHPDVWQDLAKWYVTKEQV